jgi:hypothetical protein
MMMAEEEMRNMLVTKAYGTKLPRSSIAKPDS